MLQRASGVDAHTMLVVATGLTQAPNDKQQIEPMLKTLQAQAPLPGNACVQAKVEPLIAMAREDHHPHWRARFTEPPPLAEGATGLQTMSHRLHTLAGKAEYALRKQTVEPVFGIIKSVMGFRQLSLRGLRKASGEWNLVCLAWNIKRMAVLRPKAG